MLALFFRKYVLGLRWRLPIVEAFKLCEILEQSDNPGPDWSTSSARLMQKNFIESPIEVCLLYIHSITLI